EDEATDDVRDPYWTLMAYFNSLRELGSANIRIQDDVDASLKALAQRDQTEFRVIEEVEELTSRKTSDDLDRIRDSLWTRIDDSDDPALDAVLCSNMVSVGLDVPRLGLMAVIGQPKTTAEYIQATSRIGRSHPGL